MTAGLAIAGDVAWVDAEELGKERPRSTSPACPAPAAAGPGGPAWAVWTAVADGAATPGV